MKYSKFDEEDNQINENEEVNVNVKEKASKIWQIINKIGNLTLFIWMKPILELGNRQPLEFSDLYELDSEDKAVNVNSSFQSSWIHQINTKDEPSIVMAYVYSFGYPFFLAGGLKFIHDLLLFCGPYFLNRIIYFLDDPSQPLSVGITFVVLLFYYYCYFIFISFYGESIPNNSAETSNLKYLTVSQALADLAGFTNFFKVISYFILQLYYFLFYILFSLTL